MRMATGISIFLLLCGGVLAAQDSGVVPAADPVSLVGATLAEAVSLLGAPRSVHAVRGPEAWQDDVVFVYTDRDLYWFQDRVWQVGVSAAYGLALGDSREQVLAVKGEPLQRLADAFVYALPAAAWPLRLRLGFDGAGRVRNLFVYRADF